MSQSSDSATVLARAEQLSLPLEPGAKAAQVFAHVFRRLALKGPTPEFQVEYSRFASLRSTIRLRDNCAQVRISDMLAEAPPLVLEALAEILLAQVFRRRPSREARECYLAYILRPAVSRHIDEVRSQRAKRRLLPPRGHCHDLQEIFAELNQRFFQGKLPQPRLGWTTKPSRTVLGHYDSAHNTIAVSQSLDSPAVPRYLVEYLVFHEMLHAKYPLERQGHRRVVHSAEFRKAEKRFPQYKQARQRIKRLGL